MIGKTPISTGVTGNQITFQVWSANGTLQNYTATTETIPVYTNFGSGDFSGPITVIQSLQLPDGTSYSFGYDSGASPGYYGLLASMTLPTGGQITYSFGNYTDAYNNHFRQILGRTTPDGTWGYGFGATSICPSASYVDCQQQFGVIKPNQDETRYTFTLNGGAWPTKVEYYTGPTIGGTLLATTSQCFSFVTVSGGSCTYSVTSGSAANYVHLQTRTTTLPIPSGNLTTTTQYTWDSGNVGYFGQVVQASEWNFGTALTNAADRTTTISYLGGSSYGNANIVNRPLSVTTYNNGGAIVAQTNYYWDYETSHMNAVTGTYNHDDSGYGLSNTVRGNLEAIQRLDTPTTYVDIWIAHDTTGQPTIFWDSNGNKTTYSYVTNYSNSYVTTIKNPLNQSTNLWYDWGSGLLVSLSDANGQATSFSYDNTGRPTTTTYPDGGWMVLQYPAASENQIDTYAGLTSSTPSTSCASVFSSAACRHHQSLFDGLGRLSSQILVSDPDGQTTVATQYDSNGRILKTSIPYRSTPNWETPTYDGLDRAIQMTHADNSAIHTYYGTAVSAGGGQTSQVCGASFYGYPILYVDESGNKRQSWVDAFGRVIEVDEPNPASGTLSVYTCYVFDLNNNPTQVTTTAGPQTRTYSYDMISRLKSKTDPESGTTTFDYGIFSSSTNLLCSGDPNAFCRRTAPAPNQTNPAVTVTTSYQYDSLNRLKQISYSDSTPTVIYSYDSTNCLGLAACYNIGLRTGMTDGSGSTSWAYDKMGRVWAESQTISSVTKTFSYSFNLDGSVSTMTYPSGHILTYALGSAGRPTALTDTTSGSNPIPYASSVTYAPQGDLASMQNGSRNILSTWIYNNRLQNCRMAVNTSGSAPSTCSDTNNGNILDFAYSFGTGSPPSNNGNVTRISNNRTGMSGRSVNYAYDALNRIAQGYTDATSGGYCWAETFAIDPLGNLTGIGSKSDHPGCWQESLNLGVNSQNRLMTGFGSNYQYDAAGNLIGMPSPESASYRYNAAGQLTQASDFFIAGYLYDGDGNRVAKTSSGTPYQMYWYGMHSAPLAVSDGSGNITDEYIFFAGKRIARRVISGQ